MELKRQKIQLGGISRIPTDRMTKDGECAESLNVVSDNGEIVSSLFPEEVEADGLPASWTTDCRLIFVHTTSTYTNYILIREIEGVWCVGTWDGENGEFVPFLTMLEGEMLSDITAIGNTLVIATSESMYYVLYKDGEYKFLGSQLPKPGIVFWGDERSNSYSSDRSVEVSRLGDEYYYSPYYRNYMVGDVKIDTSDDDDAETETNRARRYIWDAYDDAVYGVSEYNSDSDSDAKGQICYQPYLFRYALKLYDGAYAMQSVPTLVGSGATYPCVLGTYDDGKRAFAHVMLYKIRAKLWAGVSEDWSDIVQSIDVFCSEPINLVDPSDGSVSSDGDFHLAEAVQGSDVKNDTRGKGGTVTRWGATTKAQDEAKILNYNVFYLVGSFLVDNSGFSFEEDYDPAQAFTANQSDLLTGITFKRPDTDTLVTHTSTASDSWDDFECDHYLIGEQLETLNNRLAMWDVTKALGRGTPVLLSQSKTGLTYSDGEYSYPTYGATQIFPVAYDYRFAYVLQVNGETKYVRGKDNVYPFYPEQQGGDSDPFICESFAWLAYPDVNCKKVLFMCREIASDGLAPGTEGVRTGEWSDVYSLPMKEHPFLNCAYCWLGLGVQLTGDAATLATDEDAAHFETDDNIVYTDNYVYQSGVDNPFTFPTEGRYSFDYAILGIGAVNLPISEGQYGQFPLYVFTRGGIYAMAMNTDGTFASSAPFGRDVALSRNTITEIDRGVVFATCKGVKVIEGGQITDISPLMLGEHQTAPERIVTDVLRKVESFYNWDGENEDSKTFIGAAEKGYYDTTPFMAFIADAYAAYDYVGQRIVFFNSDYAYQYVYRIPTASWHKVVLYNVYNQLKVTLWSDDGSEEESAEGSAVDTEKYVQLVSAVNSYPQCYVSARVESGYGVLDLSTALDFTRTDGYNNGNTLGLIYTRTIDFNNPDTFKSIRDLRIRGNYEKDNVRYIMLASNDGKRWLMRKSLRGASFKFYRMILLTKLATGERISYIEFDYEERFTNRLR